MKITQIDYSAIRNANASKYNTNMQEVQNLQIQNQQEDLYVRQPKIDNIQGVNQMIQATGQAITSVASLIKDTKSKADTTDANNYLTAATNAFSIAVQEQANQGGAANLDSSGNVVISDALKNLQQQQLAEVDSMGLMTDVADSLKSALKEMHGKAETDLSLQVLKNEYSAIQTGREQQLNQAMALDASNGNYDIGYAAIDGFEGLTDNQKAVAKTSYKASVDNSIMRNTVQKTARYESLTAANAYIENLSDEQLVLATGLNAEDARSTLYNLARETYNQETQNLVDQTASAASSLLTQGNNPAIMRATINQQIQGMDPERQSKIKLEVDKAQLSYITQNIPELSRIDSLSAGDLQLLKQEVMEKEPMFWGMEEYYDNYLNMIDTQLTAYGVEADKKLSDKEKEKYQNLKQTADVIKNEYLNGNMSSATAVAFLQSEAIKDATESIKGMEDDNYILSVIGDIIDVSVPDEYKDMFNSFMKDFESNYRIFRGVDDKEFSPAIALARQNAYAELLDLIRVTPGKELTAEMISKKMEQINNSYMGKVITEMGKAAENYDGLAIEGATGAISFDKFNETNDMLGQSDSVSVSSKGDVSFRSEEAEKLSDQVQKTGAEVMKELGVTPIAVSNYTVEDDGSVTSYPTYIDNDGTRYTIQEGTVYSKAAGGESGWEEFSSVQAAEDTVNEHNEEEEAKKEEEKKEYSQHIYLKNRQLVIEDEFFDGIETRQQAIDRMNDYIATHKTGWGSYSPQVVRQKIQVKIDQKFGK